MNIQSSLSLAGEQITLLIPVTTARMPDVRFRMLQEYGMANTRWQEDFKADSKTTIQLYPAHPQIEKIVLVGLGDQLQAEDVRTWARSFYFQQREKLTKHVVVDLSDFGGAPTQHAEASEAAKLAEALANGFLLGTYRLDLFKSDRKEMHIPAQLSLLCSPDNRIAVEQGIAKGKALANAQRYTMDLVNLPANYLTPVQFADKMKEAGEQFGFEVSVLDAGQIRHLRMGALWAVAQGSSNPPTFTVMEYKPRHAASANLPKIGLVGKGVTFDTGGISIKPSDNMGFMKCDMAGGATVVGALIAAAQLQLQVHLIGVVPAAENMPDGGAFIPSAVITSYSGLTIEIDDTDAEGRLLLADALTYLNRNYSPDIMVDLATLTGSSIRALGYVASPLLTQNDSLAQELYETGLATRERLWRMPMWDDYLKPIESDMADVRNLGAGATMAGCITAAKFLEKFTEKHKAWAHLDVAGTVFTDNEFGKQRSATAFGVRLLTEWLGKKQAM